MTTSSFSTLSSTCGGGVVGGFLVPTHEARLLAANEMDAKSWGALEKQWYPDYHIATFAGWMGVPGGLCYHNGVYHVFYQHNPFSETWGPMHWGHVTSEDLVNWQHRPIALAPGDTCDRDGCFSGTAVSEDGKLYLFYTGHIWRSVDNSGSSGRGGTLDNDSAFYQQQCVAVSTDGIHFEKLGPVVRPPPGYVHFRDPKVWQQDGRWWMVCGARDVAKDLGQLLLFSTDDLLHWDDSMWQVLGVTDDKNVFMWECPDFFTLSGQVDVILYSPQGKRTHGYENRNRFQSGYLLGSWKTSLSLTGASSSSPPSSSSAARAASMDRKGAAAGARGDVTTARASNSSRWLSSYGVTQRFREIDYGHDFYAPQTFSTSDGRRLIVGWMDTWESPMPTREHGWSGCLTLPREIVLDPYTGRIRMVPPRELLQLRSAQATLPAQRVLESTSVLLVADCTAYELEISFNLHTSTAEKYGLWLGFGAELFVDAQANRLVLNRHYPHYMLSGYRSCELPASMLLRLRIFVDRSSIEVFVNDGESTFSTRVFPAEGDRALRVFSINGTADVAGGHMWKLKATVRH